ncbi:MAG TPA: aspartate dehydrogenase [Clostridium sp.]|nr:aspartate dehydrogenase [Clostridium sp.]
MKKLKLALIGCGKLNEIVAEAKKNGYLQQYEIVAVLGRDKERAKKFAEKYGCAACETIEELIEFKPEYVAEAASIQAVYDYGEKVLSAGANLVVLSIGAFADEKFYEAIKDTALKNNSKVYIASGAVGGFDVLRTAALMSPIKTTFSAKKSPESLKNTPLFREELLSIDEKIEVFRGTTKTAIGLLPTKVNVAIATALASSGTENTDMDICVEPSFKGDEYDICVDGEEVKAQLKIYSRTSKIAAWSVVEVLENAASPIVF